MRMLRCSPSLALCRPQEGAPLKKKLDEIFESTRYTKVGVLWSQLDATEL